jgi:RNA polymerase sigma-70 factor (ECF subfamily)
MDAQSKQKQCALAKRAIGGDTDAFEELYSLNVKPILYQAERLLYVKDEKEDVAQEVGMHMYTSIGTLKSPEAFHAWMYRIVTNVCRQHNRKNIGKKPAKDIDEFRETLADSNPDARPEDRAEISEMNQIIEKMIDALPTKQRLTLFMYYYENMSQHEIADALGVSEQTVGSNMAKARKALRKRMSKVHIFDDRVENLAGAAIGPAIVSAFDAGVNAVATDAQVSAITRACGERIANLGIHSGQASAEGEHGNEIGVADAIRLAVVFVVSVAILVVFIATHVDVDEQPAIDSPQTVTGFDPYRPEVQMVFSGAEGLPSHINPSSAKMIVEEGKGTAVSWHIVDTEDREVASGEGDAIDGGAFALPPGEYAVRWIVANDEGQSVTVHRAIEITN